MKNTNELTKNEAAVRRENFRIPEYRVRSDADGYFAEIAVPGVPKENVEISVEGDLLTVTAQRSDELPGSWKPVCRELSTSDYQLKLEMNAPIDTASISAKVEDGVLSLGLPVREAAKPRLIKVD